LPVYSVFKVPERLLEKSLHISDIVEDIKD
jgi:hypothetical protein